MIADAVRQPRQLVEVVRRDEDHAVVAAQRVHDVAEALRPHRVEPVRRLVEHDHALLDQQRLRQAEPLQVALRELLHALACGARSRPSHSMTSSTRASRVGAGTPASSA